MRIQSSSLHLSSASSLQQMHTFNESLNFWSGQSPGAAPTPKALPDTMRQQIHQLHLEDALTISEEARKAAEASKSGSSGALDLSEKDKQTIRLIEKLLEMLTGKKVKLHVPESLPPAKIQEIQLPPGRQVSTAAAPSSLQGWGLRYDRHESYQESQTMSVDASGKVQTSDGREISFDLSLRMSRSYTSTEDFSLRLGDAARDPLVINFDAPAALLSDQKIRFDLDQDGQADQISFLAKGSGFLALDKNDDGTINDGGELFGPASGNSFAELAAYDSDQNQWIDENDPIFNKLRIWTTGDDNQPRLLALGQAGIGALYLGSVTSDFSLKDNLNQSQGEIRKTGIFLHENGTPGTLQHIDLTL